MSDFVYDTTTPYADKSDLVPLGGGEDPLKHVVAADMNAIKAAAVDLRTAVKTGVYHGLANSSSAISSAGGLRLRSSGGQLQMSQNGGSYGRVRRFLNVEEFGADPTGVADSTTAIVAAFAAVETASAPAITGVLGATSKSVVYFPPGIYKLSDEIAIADDCLVLGEGAILRQTGATKAIFTGGGYGVGEIRGIKFRDGKIGFSHNNSSVANNVMTLVDCEFTGQTEACIETSATSGSSSIVVRSCYFYEGSVAGNVLRQRLGDCTFEDCWVAPSTAASTSAFVVGYGAAATATGAKLVLLNISGGPNDQNGYWVDVYGESNVFIKNLNADATGSGKPLLRWNGSLGRLVVEQTQASSTGVENMLFLGLPDFTHIGGPNGGPVGTGEGITLDPTIPTTDLRALGTSKIFICRGLDGGLPTSAIGLRPRTSSAAAVGLVTGIGSGHAPKLMPPRATDLITLILADDNTSAYTLSNTLANAGISGTTDDYGAAMTRVTASGSDGSVINAHTGALTGVPDGPYTAAVELRSIDHPALIKISLAGHESTHLIPAGPNAVKVSVRFEIGAHTATRTVSVTPYQMKNTQRVDIGAMHIYKGHVEVESLHSTAWGTAAPTTGRWLAGDRAPYFTPASGGVEGQVCTTAGYAGTAWTNTTAYALGDGFVTNDTGKYYQVITAGTSAGAGGPTGTGQNITDGTVHWRYLSATAAVFKAYGVVA